MPSLSLTLYLPAFSFPISFDLALLSCIYGLMNLSIPNETETNLKQR